MASEAWLDNLSEDWNSEPRSSSSAVNATNTSDLERPQSSRIPRYTATAAVTNRRGALTERRSSDLNIPPRSSPPSRKTTNSKNSTKRSLDSSQGSVVHHGTIEVTQPVTSLPRPSDHVTPDWKKLVMRSQDQSPQKDLFSPSSRVLEGIFQKPQSPADSSEIQNSVFPFLKDVDAMPSSPPPWPAGHRGSKLRLVSAPESSALSELEAVEERDEIDDSERYEEQENQAFTQRQEDPADSTLDLSSDISDIIQPESLTTASRDSASDQKATGLVSTSPAANVPGSDRRDSSILSHDNPSLATSNGFSPVYITKHATLDGQVSYAAVDFSNPDVVQRLKQMSLQDQDQSEPEPTQDESSFHITSNSGQAVPEDSFHHHLNPNVRLQRGGDSHIGSFRQRLLSPSQSTSSEYPHDSLVPSDSVSQDHRRMASATCDSQFRLPALQEETESIEPFAPSKESNYDIPANFPLTNNRLRQHDDFGTDSLNSHPEAALTHAAKPESDTNSFSRTQHEMMMEDDTSSDVNEAPLELVDSSVIRRPITAGAESSTSSASEEQTKRILAKEKSSSPESVESTGRRDDGHEEVPGNAAVKDLSTNGSRSPTLGNAAARDEAAGERFWFRGISQPPEVPIDSDAEFPSSDIDRYEDQEQASSGQTSGVQSLQQSRSLPVRLHGPEAGENTPRKPSVSTQDFLNEAMQLFQFIRARREHLETRSNRESEDPSKSADRDDETFADFTPESFSRPPSREGQTSTWRTQHVAEIKPSALTQLQRYKETGDESFLVSSIARAVTSKDVSPMPVIEEDYEISEPPGMHITSARPESHVSGSNHNSLDGTGNDLTNQSNTSTTKTSSTRTRMLSTIGPDMVAHIIDAQGALSGMRYDSINNTWVKYKVKPARPSADFNSSASSEDDPFGGIPDLSVNENEEEKTQQAVASIEYDELEDDDSSDDVIADGGATGSGLHESDVFDQPKEDASRQYKLNIDGSDADIEDDNEGDQEKEEYAVEDDRIQSSPLRPARQNTSHLQVPKRQAADGSRRREQSVMFSSPPVSHRHAAQTWTDGTEATEDLYDEHDNNGFRRSYSAPGSLTTSQYLEEDDTVEIHRSRAPTHPPSYQRTDRGHSIPRFDEHHEVSLVSTRPDGRTMSLTLSVSTPLPSHRYSSRPIIPSSGMRSAFGMAALSPLSEFTFHQDDSRHIQSRNLSMPIVQRQLSDGSHHLAVAATTNELIEKITNAVPQEPFWEHVHHLSLKDQQLVSLHMLDEFCPRVEELDVSSNKLSHLGGVPACTRKLAVTHNILTSLTDWSQLTNLQYIDLSHNNLDSLEGLRGLVHLRSISADHNRLTSLAGVLDLDGLLTLSVQHNALRELDLTSSTLKRLEHLDASHNQVAALHGLDSLPALQHLSLDSNLLTAFPTTPLPILTNLSLNANVLTTLDVGSLPALSRLAADNNALTSLPGCATHPSLSTIFLRSQTAPHPAFTLDDFVNVAHLHLRGTPLLPGLPLSRPALNLQTLDVSFAGLQSLPANLAHFAPNLRALDVSANALRSLSPVAGIPRLSVLRCADNRLSRLRRLAAVLGTLPELSEVDVRGNPVAVGFYASRAHVGGEQDVEGGLRELDERHRARLDEDTALRRRVYEMLLASRCGALRVVDGLVLDRDRVLARDEVWARLLALGVVERVDQ